MRKPVVVMDCDGVFADWVQAFCALAKTLYEQGTMGLDILGAKNPVFYTGHETVEGYNSQEWPGWTPKMETFVWDVINRRYNWFAKVPPIAPTRENIAAVQRLNEETQLYIVTSRHQGAGLPIGVLTSLWFEEYFKVRVNVIACNGHKNKVNVIEALRPNYCIDDSPKIVLEVGNRLGEDVVMAVRDFPYNRVSGLGGHLRVRSIVEFLRIVQRGERDTRVAA